MTIPAGTVSSNTTFTVSTSTSSVPASIGRAVGPVYRFGPSGMTFNPPVVMTLPFSESQIPQGVDKFRDLVIFTAPDGTTSYTSLGRAQVSGTTASAQTTHFSECVVGVVGCSAPCSQVADGGCVCPSLDGGSTAGDGGPCTVASSCTTPGGESCVEFPFANPDIESSCTSEGGTYATSACTRANAVGGCRQGSGGGGCSTTWYYTASGLTVEQVQTICSQSGTAFVSP